MSRIGILICLGVCAAALAAGAEPWLVLTIVVGWLGTLWLARPDPVYATPDSQGERAAAEIFAAFSEPLDLPLLLIDRGRIAAVNATARGALGGHISGQDARVALRHPSAIALLSGPSGSSTTIKGLTTAKSIWRLTQFRIDDRFHIVELVDQTAQADLSRAHTDFVANASHELRTPLSAIIGYAETLGDPQSEVDPATRARFLDTMGREARRMQTMVEDLMSLSRVEAEKHDAPQDAVDLATIARAATRDAAALHGKDRIVYDGGGDAIAVPGEHAQLDQLVRNLIDNAIKYGGDTDPVRVSVAAIGEGQITLVVADKGPGIAAEHLPYLTRRFYRTDPGRSRASGGTGLGLAIVKHIVERHRGTLDIASEVGVGTRVTVTLPAAIVTKM